MYKLIRSLRTLQPKYKFFLAALLATMVLVIFSNVSSASTFLITGVAILGVGLFAYVQLLTSLRINIINKAMMVIVIAYVFFTPFEFIELLYTTRDEITMMRAYRFLLSHGDIWKSYVIVGSFTLLLLFDKGIYKSVYKFWKFLLVFIASLLTMVASRAAFLIAGDQIITFLIIAFVPATFWFVELTVSKHFTASIFKKQPALIAKSRFSIEGLLVATLFLIIADVIINYGIGRYWITMVWTDWIERTTKSINKELLSAALTTLTLFAVLIAFPIAYWIKLWMNKMIHLKRSSISRQYPSIYVSIITQQLILAFIGVISVIVAII